MWLLLFLADTGGWLNDAITCLQSFGNTRFSNVILTHFVCLVNFISFTFLKTFLLTGNLICLNGNCVNIMHPLFSLQLNLKSDTLNDWLQTWIFCVYSCWPLKLCKQISLFYWITKSLLKWISVKGS